MRCLSFKSASASRIDNLPGCPLLVRSPPEAALCRMCGMVWCFLINRAGQAQQHYRRNVFATFSSPAQHVLQNIPPGEENPTITHPSSLISLPIHFPTDKNTSKCFPQRRKTIFGNYRTDFSFFLGFKKWSEVSGSRGSCQSGTKNIEDATK